jgi:hypothetical protein
LRNSDHADGRIEQIPQRPFVAQDQDGDPHALGGERVAKKHGVALWTAAFKAERYCGEPDIGTTKDLGWR